MLYVYLFKILNYKILFIFIYKIMIVFLQTLVLHKNRNYYLRVWGHPHQLNKIILIYFLIFLIFKF